MPAIRLFMTSYGARIALDHLLSISSHITPPTPYLGLSTIDPRYAGVLTGEPTTGGYVRRSLAASMGVTTLSTGIAVSTATITWPVPTASWGVVKYLFIADGSTPGAGNMMFRAKIQDARQVGLGIGLGANARPLKILAGELSVGMAQQYLTNYSIKKLIDHMLNKAAYDTSGLVPRFCLFTGDPGASGSLATEIAGTRTSIDGKLTSTSSTTGICETNADITVTPTATTTARFCGVVDAAAAGNLLWRSPLKAALPVASGTPIVFRPGQIGFRLQLAA